MKKNCIVTRLGVMADGRRYEAPELADRGGQTVTISDSGGRTACFTPSGEYICDVSECTRPRTEEFLKDLRALQAARRRILNRQAAGRPEGDFYMGGEKIAYETDLDNLTVSDERIVYETVKKGTRTFWVHGHQFGISGKTTFYVAGGGRVRRVVHYEVCATRPGYCFPMYRIARGRRHLARQALLDAARLVRAAFVRGDVCRGCPERRPVCRTCREYRHLYGQNTSPGNRRSASSNGITPAEQNTAPQDGQ